MTSQLLPGADLTKTPLLPNPNGSPPNFDDPPSLKAATYSVTLIVITLSLALLALRLRTNLKIHKKLATDDCEGI